MNETVKRPTARERRIQWERVGSEVCAKCGLYRINVSHNTDPADQIEGPDYYADVDLHEFAPSGRFVWEPNGLVRGADGRPWLVQPLP